MTQRFEGAPPVVIQDLDLLGRATEVAGVQSAALGPIDRDRTAVFARHCAYPGFRALGAVDDTGLLVGFAYGAVCRRRQWWHDQIRPAFTSAGHEGWLADAYAVTELHVLPSYQGRGLGFGLLTGLLDPVPNRVSVLSTYNTEGRARALYRSVGFVDLVTDFRFPGQVQSYALMGAVLPLTCRDRP